MTDITLGGERLGSGKKMKVELHGFERSTHDLSYIWRSTMAAGTLVPFMSEVALPGDTFDIELNVDVKTHPTIGPLFGSYKVQLDVFYVPMRLYHSALHNNQLEIGRKMSDIKLPKYLFPTKPVSSTSFKDFDNWQVNPSCILAYLGQRGGGIIPSIEGATEVIYRKFNAIPWLAYWDIYKQYYSNKQEEIGYVIHTPAAIPAAGVTDVIIQAVNGTQNTLPQDETDLQSLLGASIILVPSVPANRPSKFTILTLTDGTRVTLDELTGGQWVFNGTSAWYGRIQPRFWTKWATGWNYGEIDDVNMVAPALQSFALSNIDSMRQGILTIPWNAELNITNTSQQPWSLVLEEGGEIPGWFSSAQFTQEGLGIKTYQSDLFNNWLSTDWIDGAGGINEITAVDTSGGSFNIDALVLSRKVYDMLNRIAVSGGTYDDWLNAVYDHNSYTRAESPVYMGGLIRELVFQEVVSTGTNEGLPLGTLAGKGIMGQGSKGGKIVVKSDEPGYIMGIVSLTPRLDYSQGNKWDVNLNTMDDLHKPSLDQIGFQELIIEQMAWWSTNKIIATPIWNQKSAGKQPAWINYMTNVNRVFGNFAIEGNEMFMTLNRKYEYESLDFDNNYTIRDLTTYIDPSKFNHIFAQTSLDAQNFWTQISCDITARRKMSAKVMPNL